MLKFIIQVLYLPFILLKYIVRFILSLIFLILGPFGMFLKLTTADKLEEDIKGLWED